MAASSVTSASPRSPLLLRALLKIIWPNSRQATVTKWLVLSFIPLFGYFIWGSVYLDSWWIFVRGTLLLALMAVLCILGASHAAERIAQRYPKPDQAIRRVGLHLVVLVLISVLAIGFIMWSFNAVRLFGYRYDPNAAPWLLFSAFMVAGLLAAFTEITFALGQWQTNQLESEQLAQQQLQNQLNEVKQQVNPHFLFNSLNSLSVLIGESPPQAVHFVDELAKVYRYQLHAHRSSQLPAAAGLVSLGAELAFIHSYAHLLRTRYGPGLVLHIMPPAAEDPAGDLLPLTLQTLVDNAIQHNTLSAARPLRIHIELDEEKVCVRNTLHKRTVRVPLSYESLAGLQARYQLLGPAHALQVQAGEDEFSVAVPLVLA